ncbi:MAG: zinc metallopeptidase [Firmicutes bacterium]|nr:zinc metallopeptidase [Bacillota bacterium]
MFWYDATYVILIPAIIFTFIAQGKVTSNFNRFSKVRNRRGLTGYQAARMMLDANGLRDVQIEQVRGSLTDHYDPRSRVLRLSETVYGVESVAAISVACHEVGHAIQHAQSYGPLKVRNSIVPVVNLASSLSWPMAIVGIILLGSGALIGDTLFNIGVIAMLAVIFFHTVTLPVEYNASRRAKDQMEELGIIVDGEEARGARKVLSAAAMTYVAALATAIANLLRILAIRGNRD